MRVYQRHLPHWRQDGATYFVTFRLADSIPQAQQRALQRWRRIWAGSHPDPRSEDAWRELAREITGRTERWLDDGFGQCELRRADDSELMQENLLRFQGQRHFVSCFTIMPNHVHVVLRALPGHELEILLKDLKGFVARQVNRLLGRRGKFWKEESYDRIVRDEEHLYRIVQYFGRNPAKAGLPEAEWRRWLHPEWERAGWVFRDE